MIFFLTYSARLLQSFLEFEGEINEEIFIDLISEFESEITGEKFIDLLSNVFEVNQRQYSGRVMLHVRQGTWSNSFS